MTEDVLAVSNKFQLSPSTTYLALSILRRLKGQFLFETLPILNTEDRNKLTVYMSLSMSAKYNDRVAFTIMEVATTLNFNLKTDVLLSYLTAETLRKCEFEVLQRLNFQVGEGCHPSDKQYSSVHDLIET